MCTCNKQHDIYKVKMPSTLKKKIELDLEYEKGFDDARSRSKI